MKAFLLFSIVVQVLALMSVVLNKQQNRTSVVMALVHAGIIAWAVLLLVGA